MFVFCDGHVQLLRNSTDPSVVVALAGRNDGIVVSDFSGSAATNGLE